MRPLGETGDRGMLRRVQVSVRSPAVRRQIGRHEQQPREGRTSRGHARDDQAFRSGKQERALQVFRTLTAAGFIAAAAFAPAAAADISGAGATFPYPIYAKWADAYKKETGVGLNYQS